MKKQNTDKEFINDPLLREALSSNPFIVPQGYFSTLTEAIQFKKSLSELGDSSFNTPDHYQDQLRQDILSRLGEQRIKERVPTEGSSVPEAYFDSLQSRILARTVQQAQEAAKEEQRPIKRLQPKTWVAKRWIPYATAASLVIALALFAPKGMLENKESQGQDYAVRIDAVSTDEIIHYLASNTESSDLLHLSEYLDDRSEDISNDLSVQEIEAYLDYSL